MNDISLFQLYVKERRYYPYLSYIVIIVFLIILFLGKYLKFGSFFEIIWVISCAGYFFNTTYFNTKIVRQLKYNSLKDIIYNSPNNIESVSKITIGSSYKSGWDSVTFYFVDRREESIRFYERKIFTISFQEFSGIKS
jgi:hypothetical protein